MKSCTVQIWFHLKGVNDLEIMGKVKDIQEMFAERKEEWSRNEEWWRDSSKKDLFAKAVMHVGAFKDIPFL
jgi:DNA phosphorothioation-dependent restriction protein DptG